MQCKSRRHCAVRCTLRTPLCLCRCKLHGTTWKLLEPWRICSNSLFVRSVVCAALLCGGCTLKPENVKEARGSSPFWQGSTPPGLPHINGNKYNRIGRSYDPNQLDHIIVTNTKGNKAGLSFRRAESLVASELRKWWCNHGRHDAGLLEEFKALYPNQELIVHSVKSPITICFVTARCQSHFALRPARARCSTAVKVDHDSRSAWSLKIEPIARVVKHPKSGNDNVWGTWFIRSRILMKPNQHFSTFPLDGLPGALRATRCV
jgi:hypothetical protein